MKEFKEISKLENSIINDKSLNDISKLLEFCKNSDALISQNGIISISKVFEKFKFKDLDKSLNSEIRKFLKFQLLKFKEILFQIITESGFVNLQKIAFNSGLKIDDLQGLFTSILNCKSGNFLFLDHVISKLDQDLKEKFWKYVGYLFIIFTKDHICINWI